METLQAARAHEKDAAFSVYQTIATAAMESGENTTLLGSPQTRLLLLSGTSSLERLTSPPEGCATRVFHLGDGLFKTTRYQTGHRFSRGAVDGIAYALDQACREEEGYALSRDGLA